MVRNLCTDCVRFREIPLYIEGIMTLYTYFFLFQVYAVACAYYENQKKVPRFHSEDREFDTIERGIF